MIGAYSCTSLCGLLPGAFSLRKRLCFGHVSDVDTRMEYWHWALGACCWFGARAGVDRGSWGHGDSTVRCEILGYFEDRHLRMHLPRMFLLIKNES